MLAGERVQHHFPGECHGMRGSRGHLPGRFSRSGEVEVDSPTDSKWLEYISPATHLVDGTESKLCHDLSQVLRNVVEEFDDEFLSTGKLGAELRVRVAIPARHGRVENCSIAALQR